MRVISWPESDGLCVVTRGWCTRAPRRALSSGCSSSPARSAAAPAAASAPRARGPDAPPPCAVPDTQVTRSEHQGIAPHRGRMVWFYTLGLGEEPGLDRYYRQTITKLM